METYERRRLWVFIGLGLVVVFCLLMLFPILPQEVAELISYLGRTATGATAAVILAIRARSATGSLRRARWLLAVLLMMASAGGIISSVAVLTQGEPLGIPSVADLFYFAIVPIVLYAILSYPVSDDFAGSKMRALLDGLIVATSIGGVVYLITLAPNTFADQLPALTRAALFAYPVAAFLVVGVAVSMMLRVTGAARKELALTVLGLVIISIGEIAFVAAQVEGTYQPNSWIGVMAEIGLVLIVAGSLAGRTDLEPELPTVDIDGRRDRLGAVSRRPANSWVKIAHILPAVAVSVVVITSVAVFLLTGGFTIVDYVFGLILLSLLAVQQVVANRDRAELTARLRSRGQLFQSLVTGSSDLTTLHDRSGSIRYASPAVARTLMKSEDELLGARVLELVHPDDREAIEVEMSRLMAQPGGTIELVVRLRSVAATAFTLVQPLDEVPPQEPQWRWFQVLVHNMIGDDHVRGIVCNTRDIHEQQVLRQQLSFDAYHDTLTGLGNLALAREILSEHCFGADRTPVTLLMSDLDGFKNVNDTFGHAFGDELLRAVARRLRACVVDEDAIARIGGDEFVLVLDAQEDAQAAADRILAALRRPLLVQGTSISVQASLGMARSIDAESPEELLRNADLAMYASKAAGGGAAQWYTPSMHATTATRVQIQEGIKRALDQSLFTLLYQPIVTLPSGEISGAEALIRWDDPELGFVSPEQFIPIAEGTGIIAEIDRWVLNEVCGQIAQWQEMGRSVPRVSVNIRDGSCPAGFRSCLRR